VSPAATAVEELLVQEDKVRIFEQALVQVSAALDTEWAKANAAL
jgi:hypothetical protein